MTDDDHRLIPGLPDDISLQCIARLPLSSHSTLSHVSRSWRSILLSPSLFTVRSLLPHSDPVLTISIRSPSGLSTWHHLILPHPHRLVPLPSPLSRPSDPPPSPSATGSISGRIYVGGGCLPSAASWAETLLDPAGPHPRWVPLPSPYHLREKCTYGSAVLSGKLLADAYRSGVFFDPAASTWDPLPPSLAFEWTGRAAAVGGVLYTYTYNYMGKLRGYDWASGEWMRVEGLEKELPRLLCGVALAEFGGMLCLVWVREGRERGKKTETEILCAVVDVSRKERGGLKGSVVWMESAVLKFPKWSTVSHCVMLEM